MLVGSFQASLHLVKTKMHLHKVIVVNWKPQALSWEHLRQDVLIFEISLDLVSWGVLNNLYPPTTQAICPPPQEHTESQHLAINLFGFSAA